MNGYFFEDRDIEAALLKTSLILENKKVAEKKDSLFTKAILSLIISRKAVTIDSIKAYLEDHTSEHEPVDKSKVIAAIADLTKKGILAAPINGELCLKQKTMDEANLYTRTLTQQLDDFVLKILNKVKGCYQKKIQNEEQVKHNIKECLNYYFEVASLSFFDIDTPKDVENLSKISEKSRCNLGCEGKELPDIIVFSIGSLIKTPTLEELSVLETLSRLSITSKIMGEDPLLSSFKTTVIKDKTFIVDTEVLLYLITDHARYSSQYKALISQLLECQCKIYIPHEVIVEVCDHAEAASKRYGFVSHLIASDDPIVVDNLGNVFVEDYYYMLRVPGQDNICWRNYISNYYEKSRAYEVIYDQLDVRLDEKIFLGDMPENCQIDLQKHEQLREPAFIATKNTPKGKLRDDDKNRAIADTDVKLYLSTSSLNERVKEHRTRRKESKILRNNFYLLSNNSRIHICAKTLNISEQVICKPKALMAYLSETGWIKKENLNISSLFDNIFLLHLAKETWPDIEKMIKVGVDFKGLDIVPLRNKLGDLLSRNFESEDPEEYKDIVTAIKERGVNLQPIVDVMTDDNLKKEKMIGELQQRINQLEIEQTETKRQLDKATNALKERSAKRRFEAYQKRTGQYKDDK